MRFTKYLMTLAFVTALAPIARAEAQVVRTVVIRQGWLGINYDLTSETRDGKVSESMTVLDVIEDSPADKAGVRKGDRIVRIDGQPVSLSKFRSISRDLQPGDTLTLRLSNAGRERDVSLVASERPAQFDFSFEPDMLLRRVHGDSVRAMMRLYFDSARIKVDSIFGRDSFFIRRFEELPYGSMRMDTILGRRFGFFSDSLPAGFRIEVSKDPMEFDLPRFDVLVSNSGVAGAEFTELNPGLSQYFGTSKGLLVLRVGPGTPAAVAGLEAGDVLTRVDGQDVERVENFRRAVARSREGAVKLDVIRKGKSQSLSLELRRRRE